MTLMQKTSNLVIFFADLSRKIGKKLLSFDKCGNPFTRSYRYVHFFSERELLR